MEAYTLGSVNVDSLKESLLFLASSYPFADEAARGAFTAQVNGLDSAGNPNEGIVEPIHPTEAPAETTETETPAEDSTETTEETTGDEHGASSVGVVPEGAAIPQAVSETPAPEMSADEKIAALEAQLADAKAAKEQGA